MGEGREVTLQWTSVPVRGEKSRRANCSVAIGDTHFLKASDIPSVFVVPLYHSCNHYP